MKALFSTTPKTEIIKPHPDLELGHSIYDPSLLQ